MLSEGSTTHTVSVYQWLSLDHQDPYVAGQYAQSRVTPSAI
jgi:hypothetical protein